MPLCTLNKVASGNRTRGGKPVFSPGRAHHPSARINSLTARSRGSFARDAIGIYYGTTSGCTKAAARIIKDLMPGDPSDVIDIGDADMDGLLRFDGLIVGAPTWNTGSDEMRSMTDWDDKLDSIRELSLKGKPVAVFGLGDSCGYGDYFCDAIEELHDAFESAGGKMIGYVSPEGYDFTDSKSVRDGKFLGLPLDATNEDDLTEDRVKAWTKQLASEGMIAQK